MRRNLMLLILLGLLCGAPGLVEAAFPAQVITPEPVGDQRDGCEQNDSPEQACVLAVDRVNGPFTFMPAGDQDYFSVDLGTQPLGTELLVTVRATYGLDLLTMISHAGERAPAAIISSPTISTTLPSDLTGWLTLRVENRAPDLPDGESYSIELRRVLPPQPTHAAATSDAPSPDFLENNWSVETAAPIAIGVVYELSFACPETWAGACPGGDHDYLKVPVKAGGRYQIAAFDLGPGVDPVIELFWQDAPVASNDDAFPGGFASLVQWTAPANGNLVIRVAPRNGGQLPIVSAQSPGRQATAGNAVGAGSYRFAVTAQQSDLAHQILVRVASAANVELPRVASQAGQSAEGASEDQVAADSAPPHAIATDAPTGSAIVIAPRGTVLREAPDSQASVIQRLDAESVVSLLGQASGAWVRAQPLDGVVPGWVYGPDLRLLGESAGQPGLSPTENPGPTADAIPTPVLERPEVLHVDVVRLPSAQTAPAPTIAPRAPVTVQITLGVAGHNASSRTVRTGLSPTPALLLPLAGVRIQLVNVFGDVLTEAITPADGVVRLTREVGPQTQLYVRIPAAGIQVPVDLSQPMLTVLLAEGGRP